MVIKPKHHEHTADCNLSLCEHCGCCEYCEKAGCDCEGTTKCSQKGCLCFELYEPES
jgi:hypothetical protein